MFKISFNKSFKGMLMACFNGRSQNKPPHVQNSAQKDVQINVQNINQSQGCSRHVHNHVQHIVHTTIPRMFKLTLTNIFKSMFKISFNNSFKRMLMACSNGRSTHRSQNKPPQVQNTAQGYVQINVQNIVQQIIQRDAHCMF